MAFHTARISGEVANLMKATASFALGLRAERPVELFLVWRREDENPLLPALVEIAGKVGTPKEAYD